MGPALKSLQLVEKSPEINENKLINQLTACKSLVDSQMKCLAEIHNRNYDRGCMKPAIFSSKFTLKTFDCSLEKMELNWSCINIGSVDGTIQQQNRQLMIFLIAVFDITPTLAAIQFPFSRNVNE